MKPIILFLESDKSGNITIAKEDFRKLITEAYEQGFAEGQNMKNYPNVIRDDSDSKALQHTFAVCSSKISFHAINTD